MKDLVIISNERVSLSSQKEYKSINLDLQILPDELSNFYNLAYICRKSKIQQNHQYKIKNIYACSNILSFLFNIVLSTFKKKKFLIVSISPYTFFAFLILFVFRKKDIFVYLMSNGHEEYEHILGKKAVFLYDIMFKFVTKFSKVIVCHKRLYDPDKSFLVLPSRIKKIWLENISTPKLDMPRYLYVGRINPEKGIENFINLIEKVKEPLQLSIAGNTEKLEINQENINLLGYLSSEQKLVEAYDDNNISILPSYTEAHPYVIEESLARKRPVIIFEDIAYVKKSNFGVFVIKRERKDLLETTNYILKNYKKIQIQMDRNSLPTMEKMISRFCDILG